MATSKKSILTPSSPEYWERTYRSGELGWDLGGSTPIFDQWIKTCKIPMSICILGAGNGWDALNFARKGHMVTAIDFAKSAVKNMQIASKKNKLSIDIRHMDIFKLNQIYTKCFDIVLEYTCFCAIEPYRRREYLQIVQQILKPKGELVGLLFPIDKKPADGGPPFAVHLESTIKLISEYFLLIKKEIPSLSVTPRLGREIFIIFRNEGN